MTVIWFIAKGCDKMDCILYDDQPGSPSQLLYQQVKKQSKVCDITVKVGQWVCTYYLYTLYTLVLSAHNCHAIIRTYTTVSVTKLSINAHWKFM